MIEFWLTMVAWCYLAGLGCVFGGPEKGSCLRANVTIALNIQHTCFLFLNICTCLYVTYGLGIHSKEHMVFQRPGSWPENWLDVFPLKITQWPRASSIAGSCGSSMWSVFTCLLLEFSCEVMRLDFAHRIIVLCFLFVTCYLWFVVLCFILISIWRLRYMYTCKQISK